eukprot:1149138-Pelagomonas_calceolata.AAC.3
MSCMGQEGWAGLGMRGFGTHSYKTWVVVQPTHVGAAAEASPVRQEHEGGSWFIGLEGGVQRVAQELEHDSVIMRKMAG